MRRPFIGLAAVAVALSATPAVASAAPTVRTGAGADAAAITPARDAYRADLGGGTTAGLNGSFDGVRREINWDGVPEAQSSPNNLNPAFFNTNSPRGAVFETPGSGVQVSSNAAPQRFGNLNATYETLFKAFSPQKLFTPIGRPRTPGCRSLARRIRRVSGSRGCASAPATRRPAPTTAAPRPTSSSWTTSSTGSRRRSRRRGAAASPP